MDTPNLMAIRTALDKGLSIVQAASPQTIPGVLQAANQELSAKETTHPWVAELVEAMWQLNRAAPGVGLAAPQVGLNLRLFVVEVRKETLWPKVPEKERRLRNLLPVEAYAVINPVLHTFGEPVAFAESCLSLPGYKGLVSRSWIVRVGGLDQHGQPLLPRTVVGWEARILQHEFDHIDGKLWISRADPVPIEPP